MKMSLTLPPLTASGTDRTIGTSLETVQDVPQVALTFQVMVPIRVTLVMDEGQDVDQVEVAHHLALLLGRHKGVGWCQTVIVNFLPSWSASLIG